MVRVEEGSQQLCRGCAYDRMSARVGGVRVGVADLRKPIGIGLGFRVTIRRRLGSRSPIARNCRRI
jgi:hypothetical protein